MLSRWLIDTKTWIIQTPNGAAAKALAKSVDTDFARRVSRSSGRLQQQYNDKIAELIAVTREMQCHGDTAVEVFVVSVVSFFRHRTAVVGVNSYKYKRNDTEVHGYIDPHQTGLLRYLNREDLPESRRGSTAVVSILIFCCACLLYIHLYIGVCFPFPGRAYRPSSVKNSTRHTESRPVSRLVFVSVMFSWCFLNTYNII